MPAQASRNFLTSGSYRRRIKKILVLAALLSLAAAPAAGAANVWFTKGERLHAAPRAASTLPSALRALLAGPTRAERARGLSTNVPAGTRLRAVTVRNGIATVDLSGRFESGGGTASMTARLRQLVWTATAFPQVDAVRIALDGRVVRAIGGEGVMVDRPLTRRTRLIR